MTELEILIKYKLTSILEWVMFWEKMDKEIDSRIQKNKLSGGHTIRKKRCGKCSECIKPNCGICINCCNRVKRKQKCKTIGKCLVF